ncbi:unnamed protein product [Acanthoscelides obtectus]|uniref:Uncharacterized protein n=1 Tax=Acanthoscelides obtectus TaxID=200917 RepID=A0A9P0L8N2_ACAOB|nr:unnamed protein product [Acanthoscelides obtectus]CAK1631306.1 hypothetical protein AOBTE_LOCUS6875 [Acanthoscelides obtectus]
MEVDINRSEITAVCRVGRQNGSNPRHILVSFKDNCIKIAAYNKKKMLKGTKIVVKEDLTIQRLKAMKPASEKFGFRNVWTVNGNVFARTDKGVYKSEPKTEPFYCTYRSFNHSNEHEFHSDPQKLSLLDICYARKLMRDRDKASTGVFPCGRTKYPMDRLDPEKLKTYNSGSTVDQPEISEEQDFSQQSLNCTNTNSTLPQSQSVLNNIAENNSLSPSEFLSIVPPAVPSTSDGSVDIDQGPTSFGSLLLAKVKRRTPNRQKRRKIYGSAKVLTNSEYMQEIISKTEKGKAHKKKANKKKNEVLSDSEDEEIGEIYEDESAPENLTLKNIVESEIEPDQDVDTSTIKKDDYVLVQFPTKKKIVYYVANVESIDNNGSPVVSYLRRKGNSFVYPSNPETFKIMARRIDRIFDALKSTTSYEPVNEKNNNYDLSKAIQDAEMIFSDAAGEDYSAVGNVDSVEAQSASECNSEFVDAQISDFVVDGEVRMMMEDASDEAVAPIQLSIVEIGQRDSIFDEIPSCSGVQSTIIENLTVEDCESSDLDESDHTPCTKLSDKILEDEGPRRKRSTKYEVNKNKWHENKNRIKREKGESYVGKKRKMGCGNMTF